MAKIVFWSPEEGKTGCTHVAIAVSSLMGITHKTSSLLIDANSNAKKIASSYTMYEDLMNANSFNDTNLGMNAIMRLIKSNKLSPDIIQNYSKPVLKGRLDILYSAIANTTTEERENLLSQISGYMDINVEYKSNGTVNVRAGNVELVNGAEQKVKFQLVAGDATTPAVIQAQDMDGNLLYANINDEITGGYVGGVLDMVNTKDDGTITISSMIGKINEMANAFANEVNNVQTYQDGDIQAKALGTDPVTGEMILIDSTEPIFTFVDGKLTVNQAVIDNPNLVAAARVDTSVADWEKNVGNADNIIACAQLRDKNTMSTFGGANNTTFEGFLTHFAGEVGIQEDNINSKLETANALNESAKTNYQSITGVNLDEELSDMIKFQRAYEASARVFNTANEIYQVLVNLGK